MKNIFRNFLLLIFLSISLGFSLLPRKISLFIGRQLGTIIYLFSIRKDVAKKNIDNYKNVVPDIKQYVSLINHATSQAMTHKSFLSNVNNQG